MSRRTMLRVLVRRSAEDVESVESYVAHLEGRLDAISRVRTRADAFGEAGLRALISDELMFHVVYEGERVTLTGPDARLRRKPAQAMALALHELASNAIEHGALGNGRDRVDVAWRVETDGPEPVLILVWKETGGTGLEAPIRRGFGTVVLEEMLAYELQAQTILAFEPDGPRYTVRLPLTPRIGRLEPA